MTDVNPEAQYYLHTNGDLIYKPNGGVIVEEGGFVQQVWMVADIVSPESYLEFLEEARKLGANQARIKTLHDAQTLSQFIPNAATRLGIA